MSRPIDDYISDKNLTVAGCDAVIHPSWHYNFRPDIPLARRYMVKAHISMRLLARDKAVITLCFMICSENVGCAARSYTLRFRVEASD